MTDFVLQDGGPETYEGWLLNEYGVRFATEEERADIYEAADTWLNNAQCKNRFTNSRFDAKSAVAEYAANLKGITLAVPSWRRNHL